MSKRKILLQLDTDRHPSVFDSVVAVDGGADELFRHGGVEPEDVEGLIHGAMFTRGPADLKSTAVFIGGHNVARAEELLGMVTRAFFGPLRCSVMLDPNGANTTAAAAVLAAARHLDLENTRALVLGGTGPVGQRVALLLGLRRAEVWLGSRTIDRANDACAAIRSRNPDLDPSPVAVGDSASFARFTDQVHLIIAAGAAGARLISRDHLRGQTELKVLVDLNAVPPSGIEGVEPGDSGRQAEGIFHYGAIGVGGMKMKIHKAAIARLFESNDQILDAEQILQIGLRLMMA